MLFKFVNAVCLKKGKDGSGLVELVVFTFAAIAKSNFVFIGRFISFKDR